jgi:hypothetical protein
VFAGFFPQQTEILVISTAGSAEILEEKRSKKREKRGSEIIITVETLW